MDQKMTAEERAQLVLSHLEGLLDDERMKDFQDFIKGGISVCCLILDVRNPYTGRKFEGDLADFVGSLEEVED